MDNEELHAEIKHHFKLLGIRLDGIERRVGELATREDLQSVKDEILSQVDIKIEAMETRLLSEFWKWGRTAEIKLRAVPLIETRLAAVESRLFDAEEKIYNLQHPPIPHAS
mgnify:CR=1 FL=1